ncbi:MAG: hypothetical protein AVDCRST_MAG64-3173, partial [uncultured Phycisphaerae bacterium]
PKRLDAPGGVTFGYEDEVLLMVPVTLPADLAKSGDLKIDADVSWLVCKTECVKGKAKLAITLPVSTSPGKPAHRELFDTWRARLPVAADSPAAAAALAKVAQPAAASGASGTRPSQLDVEWKQAPKKVEWFPVATRAVGIDEVDLRHEGKTTRIAFKPTVYKPDGVPEGRVDSVLVFEGADGKRVGVSVPITVPLAE